MAVMSMGGAYSTKSKLGAGVPMTVVYYEAVWGGGGGGGGLLTVQGSTGDWGGEGSGVLS